MKGKLKIKGEITTILAVGALVFLGISTLVSSLLVKNKQTVKTRASSGDKAVASLTCIKRAANNNSYVFFRRADVGAVCDLTDIKKGPQNDAWKVGKENCTLNGGCAAGDWCYYFDSVQANSRCLRREPSCDNGACINADAGGKDGFVDNGCFKLKTEFTVKNEGSRKAFYSWVVFDSQTAGDVQLLGQGTGDKGDHLAGWNGFAGGSYVYGPEWTQNWSPGNSTAVVGLEKGQGANLRYTGYLRNCNPQSVSVACSLGVTADGQAYVEGDGCGCKDNSCVIGKPTPTPIPERNNPTPTPVPSRAVPSPTLPIPTPVRKGTCNPDKDKPTPCSNGALFHTVCKKFYDGAVWGSWQTEKCLLPTGSVSPSSPPPTLAPVKKGECDPSDRKNWIKGCPSPTGPVLSSLPSSPVIPSSTPIPTPRPTIPVKVSTKGSIVVMVPVDKQLINYLTNGSQEKEELARIFSARAKKDKCGRSIFHPFRPSSYSGEVFYISSSDELRFNFEGVDRFCKEDGNYNYINYTIEVRIGETETVVKRESNLPQRFERGSSTLPIKTGKLGLSSYFRIVAFKVGGEGGTTYDENIGLTPSSSFIFPLRCDINNQPTSCQNLNFNGQEINDNRGTVKVKLIYTNLFWPALPLPENGQLTISYGCFNNNLPPGVAGILPQKKITIPLTGTITDIEEPFLLECNKPN